MKSIVIITIVFLSSCGVSTNPSVKFEPKVDTVQVSYLDSLAVNPKSRGPFIITAVYSTTRTFKPVDNDSSTTKGEWKIDTGWWAKIQTDTLKDPAKHTYSYQPFDKKYIVSIFPIVKPDTTKPKK